MSSSNTFSLDLWCEDKIYVAEKKQALIYVSIHCPHCSKFVKEKNIIFKQKSEQLPWLVFKENKPDVIRQYVMKHQLDNKICISNKNIKKCLKNEVTPQLINCFQHENEK